MHLHLPWFASHSQGMQRFALGLVSALLALTLAACGFHLKGTTPLPFDTLYTNISDNDAFGMHLRRVVLAASPNLRFTETPKDAQAVLTQLSMREDMREIAIGPDGLVEEYELTLIYSFQLTDAKGNMLLPPTTLESRREVPYDSSALAAKQGEISNLFFDMRRGMADRIVRRLTSPQVIDAYLKYQAEEPAAVVEPLIRQPKLEESPSSTLPTPTRYGVPVYR
ncbi:LPS-assembly lipoprotein LptE [Mesopusillimonas faecipullorum]|nr:LPS assembly lipoprotein LptE [Mesopusillimonas faecipullorum]